MTFCNVHIFPENRADISCKLSAKEPALNIIPYFLGKKIRKMLPICPLLNLPGECCKIGPFLCDLTQLQKQ